MLVLVQCQQWQPSCVTDNLLYEPFEQHSAALRGRLRLALLHHQNGRLRHSLHSIPLCRGTLAASLHAALLSHFVATPHAGSGFISSGQQSDHLLMVAAYNAWEDAKVQVGISPCVRVSCSAHRGTASLNRGGLAGLQNQVRVLSNVS